MDREQTPSQRIVAQMMALNPAIQCRGFRKAMAALFPHSEVGECCAFIPDAFHVSRENETVTLIEVDDTHPIDHEKASKIGDFTLAVEDCLWEVVVIVIDYAGNVRAAVPGWAYLQVYTQGLTPERCLDLTPAAQAAARIIRAGASVQTTADELADRL